MFSPPTDPSPSPLPGSCNQCSCHPLPTAYASAGTGLVYHIPAPGSMAEGCYDIDPTQMANPESYNLPDVVIWRAECPSCLSGECQAQGFNFYHPSFQYTTGCYVWHGGYIAALGSEPVALGSECDCAQPSPGASPDASPSVRLDDHRVSVVLQL